MRLFGGDRMDRISSFMEKTQIPDDMPIQASQSQGRKRRARSRP
jgi:hypothetical protein